MTCLSGSGYHHAFRLYGLFHIERKIRYCRLVGNCKRNLVKTCLFVFYDAREKAIPYDIKQELGRRRGNATGLENHTDAFIVA